MFAEKEFEIGDILLEYAGKRIFDDLPNTDYTYHPQYKGNIIVCNNRFVPILLDVKIGLLCLNIQSKIIIYNLSFTGKIWTDLLCKTYNADQ